LAPYTLIKPINKQGENIRRRYKEKNKKKEKK
jgi:hypothetical protein